MRNAAAHWRTDVSTTLITGVSSGIGKATAKRFARAGWRVIGTYLGPPVEEVPTEWPGDVTVKKLDLADLDSVRVLAGDVLNEFGAPDVLLNNAGIVMYGPFEDETVERIKRIFDINVFGQIELTRAFLPAMRERGSGLIANVTSLGGRSVFPFFTTYNASKHAMEGFSEGLWHELRPFGVRVKAIEPGYVRTPIWDKGMKREGKYLQGSEPYRPYMTAIAEFNDSIQNKTPPEKVAEEIWDAINDPSDRLRYPVAAYARGLLKARRVLGEMRVMRTMHTRYMGKY